MLLSKVGSIIFNPTTGHQSVTGVGFTPKVVFFLATPDTVNIVSEVANMHISFGCAISPSLQFVACNNSRNGIVTSQSSNRSDNTHVIYVADPPGTMTPDFSASLFSLDGDGFTLNVDDAPPINYRYQYWALGGDDISQMALGFFGSKGSTGVQSVAGLPFQPDLLLICSPITFPVVMPGNGGGASFALGWGTPAVQVAMGTWSHSIVNPQLGQRLMAPGRIVEAVTGPFGVTNFNAVLTSFAANGFNLNWINHSIIANINMFYVAFKGTVDFKFMPGLIQLPTSPGSVSVTGIPWNPGSGLFMSSHSELLTDSTKLSNSGSIGFASQNDMAMVGWKDKNAQSPTINSHTSHSLHTLRRLDPSTATIIEQNAVASWNTGGVTFASDIATSPASYMGYLLMGSVGSVPPHPPEPGISDNTGFVV